MILLLGLVCIVCVMGVVKIRVSLEIEIDPEL